MDLEQGSVWSFPLSPPLEVTRQLIEVPLPRSIEVPLTPSSMTALEVGSPLIEVPPHNKIVSSTRIKPHKDKPKSSSISDSDGFRLRAACVCVRSTAEEEVLLVSRRSGPGWIIPGGKVEPEELGNPSLSAAREAREEAGVVGTLGRNLGTFENNERGHRTTVFVLYVKEVEADWAESGRDRQWFSIDDAQTLLRVNRPIHSSYLDSLKHSRSTSTYNSN